MQQSLFQRIEIIGDCELIVGNKTNPTRSKKYRDFVTLVSQANESRRGNEAGEHVGQCPTRGVMRCFDGALPRPTDKSRIEDACRFSRQPK